MSGGGGTSTIQRSDPWAGVQPSLRKLFSSAEQNVDTPKQFYPHTTVAPWSGTTLRANNMLFNRALQGNPLLDQAQDQAFRTVRGDYLANPSSGMLMNLGQNNFVSGDQNLDSLRRTGRGDFLNSNPYLDQMFGQAAGRVGKQFSKSVLPNIASMFSGAGRFGSNQMAEGVGAATDSFGDTMRGLASDIYGNNYANERQLMQDASSKLGAFGLQGAGINLGALSEFGNQFGRERNMMLGLTGASPGLAEADYGDIAKMEGLGLKEEANHQARINEAINRFNFGQNEYGQRLAEYNSLLQGTAGLGGASQTSMSGGGNPMMGALGGGLLGASILPALGPAVLGGLGGVGAGAGAFAGPLAGAMGGMGLGPIGLLGGALLGGLMSR